MALEHVYVSEYITAMIKKHVFHFCSLLMCAVFIYVRGVFSTKAALHFYHAVNNQHLLVCLRDEAKTLITICSFTDAIRDAVTRLCIIEYLSKAVSCTRAACVKMLLACICACWSVYTVIAIACGKIFFFLICTCSEGKRVHRRKNLRGL